jgi:hypothetical protein
MPFWLGVTVYGLSVPETALETPGDGFGGPGDGLSVAGTALVVPGDSSRGSWRWVWWSWEQL